MKKVAVAVALFMAVFVNAQTFTGTVVKVKDGDTVVILDSLKTMHTIRLAGVDAPEKTQDFGVVAKQFVSDAIFAKVVKTKVITTDRYGRSIGWIYYDGKNIAEELLKAGLAWHYKQYDKQQYLQDLEDKARENKVGLWILPNPIYPSLYRKDKTKP
ncbi:MAG: thermonuclease family protein [Methylotenera sp.]|nr:thermonuclease family protein [Flavobacterium sp.]